MFGNNPFTSPTYCGYCKSNPCRGHSEQEHVSWYPAELDSNVDTPEEENQEGPLTYEDGTPYVPTRERQLRTDYRSPERAWRPQR